MFCYELHLFISDNYIKESLQSISSIRCLWIVGETRAPTENPHQHWDNGEKNVVNYVLLEQTPHFGSQFKDDTAALHLFAADCAVI